MEVPLLLIALSACATTEPAPPPPEPTALEVRVSGARDRLTADPAGVLVWRSIEAHGGLEPWLSAGLTFTFDYAPIGRPESRRYTRNEVDVWTSRARQTELEGAPEPLATFGWDGEVAWIDDPDGFRSPRFWALTPYYFVGIPFVMGDPGTRFEQLPDAPLDGVDHHLVKVTFATGTGDAPDDYYILYLHPETSRVGALRYVVSYPGFFPEGGHSAEKLMKHTEPVEVGGLWFAGRLDTYAWSDAIGDEVTEITVTDIALGEPIPEQRFAPPEGARVIAEIEPR